MKKKNLVLLILLFLLCIGAVELAACRHFDPERYQQITDPIRQGLTSAITLCRNTIERSVQASARASAQIYTRLQDSLTSLLAKPEPEAEDSTDQLAGDPALISDLPISDPAVTELVVINGREKLTGGSVNLVYFNQGDAVWANQPYGSDNIGVYGCGPTAMAMVVSSLTDQEVSPADMAQWAAAHGYWASKHGSYLSLIEGASAAYGLHAESFTDRTPEGMVNALLSGKILVALVGPGHFTQRGHFILLRGVTLSGTVLIADPNSVERSLVAWDPQLILDELSSSTSNGAPLWAISLPED